MDCEERGMIRDYIPESVKEVVRKYKHKKTIKSFRGGGRTE